MPFRSTRHSTPGSPFPPLRAQVAQARALWAEERAAGRPGVWLPPALAVKFPPAAAYL